MPNNAPARHSVQVAGEEVRLITPPLPAQPVSQEEREWLRQVHVETPRYPGECRACTRNAFASGVFPILLPCPVIRTLDALEAAERRESALRSVANAAQAFRLNVVHQFSENAHEAFADLIGDRLHYYQALVTALLGLDARDAHDARQKGADHA